MYVSAQPPPILSLAVPAEISMNREMDGNALKLAPYQIVQASVSEGGLERVLLNIKGRQLSAETKVPLKSGQKLNLQVVNTSPQIHLRIMEETELRHLFRLLHSLSENMRLLPLIQNMEPGARQAAAEVISLLGPEPGNLSGKDFAGLWQKLGLNLEALLAEGKSQEASSGFKALLLVHANLQGTEAKGGQEASTCLDHLLLFQLCRYRLAQENVVFLPLPFEFLEQGYLLAEKQQREGGGKQEGKSSQEQEEDTWKISLNLSLSRLGNLQVLMLFEGTELRLRMLCQKRQSAQIVSKEIHKLGDRLTTVSLKSFSVDTGAPDPAINLLKRLAPDGDHFLEAKA
ncbi:MAG: flagellar hook-length control protein FliK [Desulfobacterales bacterium]